MKCVRPGCLCTYDLEALLLCPTKSDSLCDFQKWVRLYKSRCDYTEENATEARLFEGREEVTVNSVALTPVKMSPGRIHFCS
jgi:hypothetical protein